MSPNIPRTIALMAFTAITLWLSGRHESHAIAQAAGQGDAGVLPAGRGGRGPGAAQGPGAAVPGRGQRGGGPTGPPTAQASATNDLTGYWVSLVTEDWRWHMVVPPKGNADSIPLSPAGRAALDAWDPAKDEAEGN